MNYKEDVRLLKMAKQSLSNLEPGMCYTFITMYDKKIISEKEHSILRYLIAINKPLETYVDNQFYYFEKFKTEPRLNYLEHLILLNNPNFFIRFYYKFKFRKLYSYK
jgi:hypothetical protein